MKSSTSVALKDLISGQFKNDIYNQMVFTVMDVLRLVGPLMTIYQLMISVWIF